MSEDCTGPTADEGRARCPSVAKLAIHARRTVCSSCGGAGIARHQRLTPSSFMAPRGDGCLPWCRSGA